MTDHAKQIVEEFLPHATVELKRQAVEILKHHVKSQTSTPSTPVFRQMVQRYKEFGRNN